MLGIIGDGIEETEGAFVWRSYFLDTSRPSDFDFLDNRSDAFFIIRSTAVGRKMAVHGLRG
jgi:hypothetical protein